jgi:hypothetical protein|tara:strand:+ start:806 stop:1114 length:309 start_codon:yes stop_codon:yes gene_type:complete
MELLGTLFYAICISGIAVLIIKTTKTYWIDPEGELDFPDWVNMPTDLEKLELNHILMEAIEGRVVRLKRIDEDSLDDLRQDMVLIALAYGEGCVRHSENLMN